VKYYPNMRHDLFNETCRDDVFKNVILFIKKRRKK
jgi:alpha-beta hydrolase superfamily lysophospholipase